MKTSKISDRSARKTIEVGCMEFDEGGNTIWVQSVNGTVLRIKCSGRIVVNPGCSNNVPHADIFVSGDINVCMPKEKYVKDSGATGFGWAGENY